MLSKPSSASSGSSNAPASIGTDSTSRTAFAYSMRFNRCAPTRPGCGSRSAAASSVVWRYDVNAVASAVLGRGRGAGGICPVRTLCSTFSQVSA